jgi:hypothetical protein
MDSGMIHRAGLKIDSAAHATKRAKRIAMRIFPDFDYALAPASRRAAARPAGPVT